MSIATDLQAVLEREPLDMARASLVVARLEFPTLDVDGPLDTLDRLGRAAASRLDALPADDPPVRVAALNTLVFGDERFAGNRAHYDDFRNSLLNVVLERRVGIPITLAIVYMEIARRAGITVQGVSFPGHFLMRVPAMDDRAVGPMILDPFDAGTRVSDEGCRRLLARHLDAPVDEAAFDRRLLEPCTPRQMLTRLLNNLKRAYLDLRSFGQARTVTDLLLTVDPTLTTERRDRGLLAYHLDDYPSALRDLDEYLRMHRWAEDTDREERDQIWEHVKALRRRVASRN